MSASSKRAQNTRSYKVQAFQPGDLVFVWRIQTRGPAASARTGGFTGPCRALATETRRTEDGQFRPGSCAWVREISIPSERCREPKSATTDYEKTKVRAAIGPIGALRLVCPAVVPSSICSSRFVFITGSRQHSSNDDGN